MTSRYGNEGKRYGMEFIAPDTWMPAWPPRGPEWQSDEIPAMPVRVVSDLPQFPVLPVVQGRSRRSETDDLTNLPRIRSA